MNMRSRTAEVAPIVVFKGDKGACSILEYMGRGPCYHIAAVVGSFLCGLVGKIVARMEENCKRLWAMNSTGRTWGGAWCDIIRNGGKDE